MTYDYTIKIDLEENEKEAVNVLVQAYNQCHMDDRIDCEDCPFYVDDIPCIPFLCTELKEKLK